jgi:hypothetical protein
MTSIDITALRVTEAWMSAANDVRTSLDDVDPNLTGALDKLVDVFNTPAAAATTTGPAADAEPPGYPAEKRIADLEKFIDDRHLRENALHHARKAWGEAGEGSYPNQHADDIVLIAQTFERYLRGEALDRQDVKAPAAEESKSELVSIPPVFGLANFGAALADLQRFSVNGPKVMTAALEWVDRAHLNNSAGLDYWRNWADDHDIKLIDAVLALKGLPPLERNKP